MTLPFFMSGVDFDRIPPMKEINHRYNIAKARGLLHNPREDVLFFRLPVPGTLLFNSTRLNGYDPTDAASLTRAMIEARRQVAEMSLFLKTLPGFEHAFLSRIGSKIGVRESRRIRCDYMFSEEDMNRAAHFEDSILRSTSHVDIHSPDRKPYGEKGRRKTGNAVMKSEITILPSAFSYEILSFEKRMEPFASALEYKVTVIEKLKGTAL